MIQTERHFHPGSPEIVKLCETSKLLYNRCNYYMRQAWFGKRLLPGISELVQLVQNEGSYKNLHNTKTAKQTIRKVLSDWSNYKKALNSYAKDKGKFFRYPKPPHYKKKLTQVIFFDETIRRKPLKQNILQPTNDIFSLSTNVKQFKQVVITPKTFGFVIEVSYQVEKPKPAKVDKNHICCIDLGVNNLCAITSDQHSPVLINGRIIKSINQWYNKKKNKRNSRKRYWRIENYFHHVSNWIIQDCIEHQIGTIIIGKNDYWKQKQNNGKKNNQTFQSIPFCKLIQKIQYKSQLAGINIIFTEEAYTSKASFLDRDPLPEYGELEDPKFSGRRVKRGLYKSQNEVIVNADVNGSANIGRKVIQDSKILARLDRSLAARPRVVNPLKESPRKTVEVRLAA